MPTGMREAVRSGVEQALDNKEPIQVNVSSGTITISSGSSIGILDSSDNRIDPATKQNQETIISKLDTNLSTRASETTLSEIKTQTDKLFTQQITINYNNTSPLASTEYTTTITNVSHGRSLWVFVRADQAVDVVVEGGFQSDGSDFAPLSGYKIQSADFQVGEWNNIDVLPRIPYIRVKVTTGTTAPTYIYVRVVKAY